MNKLDASSFIKIWNEFSKYFCSERYTNWQELYQNDAKWSDAFLGGRTSGGPPSPIGRFFEDKFHNLRYRREDALYDLTFSLEKNFMDIPYIVRDEELEFQLKDEYWPSHYSAVIEIENKCHYSWQEMIKLTQVRSPLKVLATYFFKWPNEYSMLENSFQTIINQANSKYDEDSEYILLIGDDKQNKLNWQSTIFDSKGSKISTA